MPKSKRERIVSLTMAKPKGRERKEAMLESIIEALDKFSYVYLFEQQNTRNSLLQDVRTQWGNNDKSKFVFGKNTIMQLALGKSESDEPKPNLHLLSAKIAGQCGLFMTNEPSKKVLKWFSEYEEQDYPRSGNEATHDVILPAGPLPQFSHAIEPHLRVQLGMPVELKNGIINVRHEFVVCRKGDVMNPSQCKILKLLEIKMSTFKIVIKAYWHDGKFHDLEENEKMEE